MPRSVGTNNSGHGFGSSGHNYSDIHGTGHHIGGLSARGLGLSGGSLGSSGGLGSGGRGFISSRRGFIRYGDDWDTSDDFDYGLFGILHLIIWFIPDMIHAIFSFIWEIRDFRRFEKQYSEELAIKDSMFSETVDDGLENNEEQSNISGFDSFVDIETDSSTKIDDLDNV